MFRFLTTIRRLCINKSSALKLKRQLSTAQRSASNNFTWKLVSLGCLSAGFYFIISIENGYTAGRKKKVVVLGSGWAAVNFIRNLKPELYDLSIVSPANYFLFTPLLPSVTVGTVEIRSVVEPIRNLIHKKHKNTVNFYEGECIDVDIENQTIRCKDKSGNSCHTTQYKVKPAHIRFNCTLLSIIAVFYSVLHLLWSLVFDNEVQKQKYAGFNVLTVIHSTFCQGSHLNQATVELDIPSVSKYWYHRSTLSYFYAVFWPEYW